MLVNPDCNTHPLVTVCLTTANWGPFLGDAIDAVLKQSYWNWEMIILRDQYTSEVESILQTARSRYPDRIRVIEPESHWPEDFSAPCLGHARGKFIAVLMPDDCMPSTRLEEQMCYLRSHPEVQAVRSVCQPLLGDDQQLEVSTAETPRAIDNLIDALHRKSLVAGISLLIRAGAATALLAAENEIGYVDERKTG